MRKAAKSMARSRRKELGGYTLGKTLGRGKFGVVRLVTHKETGKEYAMKVINKHEIKDSAEMVRIRRETEVLTNLDHPHIVNLQEVFETSKYVCIVMEYAAGGDLFHYIIKQSDQRIEYNEALRLMRQMVSAVSYCHVHYVVHRDLKPENIFLDDKKNIKIGDFGFSRTFAPDAVLDTPCGSLAYAAPEVISGKVYRGPGADLWSLGCIFYVLLVGELPFDAETDYQVVQNIRKGRWHDSPHLRNTATRDLLRKMLQPRPCNRISMGDVQRHAVLWQDRPLLYTLIKPFADVFAAKKPYTDSSEPSLHRSFSDSEISSIEGTLAPPKTRGRRSSFNKGDLATATVEQVGGEKATGKVKRLDEARTSKSAPSTEKDRVTSTKRSKPLEKPKKTDKRTDEERQQERAARKEARRLEKEKKEKAMAPTTPKRVHEKHAKEEKPPQSAPPSIIIEEPTLATLHSPARTAVPPSTSHSFSVDGGSPARNLSVEDGEASDVEVILVMPDLMAEEEDGMEAPPIVILEATPASASSSSVFDDFSVTLDGEELKDKMPSPETERVVSASCISQSGNTLQIPTVHRQRCNSLELRPDSITTLFNTHKHPKERFRF